MKTINCSGSPYDVGFAHGSGAAEQIRLNIAIYTAYYDERANIPWDAARKTATEKYMPTLEKLWPEILEEMRGIAAGVGSDIALGDILALNLRSEILLTTYSDGCTALAQRTPDGTLYLAQNWDWIDELKNGLVFLRISPADSDMTFQFLTEAGIVGKIGMNSAGVGICLNAIRLAAKDTTKMPVHIMMRKVLQHAKSFDHAVELLASPGLSSAVNFMIADKSGKFADVECTPSGNQIIEPTKSAAGDFVVHTNHLVSDFPGLPKDTPTAHSLTRYHRIIELTQLANEKGIAASFDTLRARLSDLQGWPNSICKGMPEGETSMEYHPTVMTALMNMTSGKARFLLGKPSEDVPIVEFTV